MGTLLFEPLKSRVDVTFWSPLGDHKLHSLKLEEGPVPLGATWAASNHAELPGFLSVTAASLPDGEGAPAGTAAAEAEAPLPPRGGFEAAGELYALNTVERIVSFDRKAAVQQACDRVWAAIQCGEAEADPRLLQRLVLLTYCDLKHYKYRYWFSFPALQPPQPFTADPPMSLQHALGPQAGAVAAACGEYMAASGLPACLVWITGSASGDGDSSSGGSVVAAPLADWHRLKQQEASGSGLLYLAAADSSNLPANPGWPLRNLLLMAAARWQCSQLRLLCLRERHGRPDPTASLCLEVGLPQLPPGFSPMPLGGWEVNERGKKAPRTADLAPSMDPRRLAESAVDLNLRLMRWRAAPALDVSAISATRCLLFGAGTLGCSVARTLLGWGVRHITFVDNSRVAYSNPVRQSLFHFEDCLEGGKPKAAAAAESLARIFPGVTARGVQLSVPMPGHPVADTELPQVRRVLAELEALVESHDVAFLLMDTRESRWLPTLLCAARGRLAINAALGFDGFMVMRHGAPVPVPAPLPPAVEQTEQGQEGQQRPQGVEQQQAEAVATDAAAAAGGAAPAAAAVGAASSAVGRSGAAEAEQEAAAVEGTGAAEGGSTQAAAAASGGSSSDIRSGAFRLGCYFCNDVVAPVNSTVDRTLDQQCTVARPGLSAIAGSLAVELMAAVLQHPLGAAAPAAGTEASRRLAAELAAAESAELPLGEVPHMIRGQLSGFSQMCLTGQAFRQCTACSEAVVQQYRQRGHDFLLQGLLDPKALEDLTGLTELHRASEAALEAWASSSDSDSEEEGEERGEGQQRRSGGAAGGKLGQGAAAGAADAAAGEEDEWEEL